MPNCPRCNASGTISVRLVLAAKPPASHALAGVQIKFAATAEAIAECSACGLSVPGWLNKPTYTTDGTGFTGGDFVAGPKPGPTADSFRE